MTTDIAAQGALTEAGRIIERFGGIRPMAHKMDVPVTTVQGWKKRDIIPENRRADVLRAAQLNGIDLSDLVKDAANQNTGGSFGAAVAEASRSPYAVDAGLLNARVRAAERRAVQKGALITVILLALAGGVTGAVFLPARQHMASQDLRLGVIEHWLDDMKTSAAPADVAALEQRVQALEGKINGPASAGNAAAPPDAALLDRMTKLEQQVGALAGPAGLQALADKIADLQQDDSGRRVLAGAVVGFNGALANAATPDQIDAALQQAAAAQGQFMAGVAPADTKAAALLLGIAQLHQALDRDAPFADDLTLLQKISGNDNTALNDSIARLAPAVAKGVPTLPLLNDQFAHLSGDIVAASLQGRDVSVADRAKARLNALVEVRRDGDLVTGTGTQETVDRAQTLLRQGDVAGAIAALKTLKGSALSAAQPWIASAETALLARQVADALTQRAVALIGQTPGGLAMAAKGNGVAGLLNRTQAPPPALAPAPASPAH